MKLSEIKSTLSEIDELTFVLPNGTRVPAHFHITEIGQIHRRFIDCGGTVRDEKLINFQLWEDGDFDHRLGAEKLQKIIALSEKELGLADLDVEVEYQSDTIGRYGLEVDGAAFLLTVKKTDCLAKDTCGVPASKPKIRLSELTTSSAGCCSSGTC